MRSIKIGAGVTAEGWTEQAFNYVPFTPLFNTPGNPAVPLPLHWTPGGLPVGVQWVGGLGDESTLTTRRSSARAGHAVEKAHAAYACRALNAHQR